MGRSIVITSGKGGVGKSTLCANLALALVRRGRKVLLLDADTGLRSLDLLVGLQDHTVYDLSDAAQGLCRLKQAIVKSREHEGLSLMAAAQNRDCTCVTPQQMKALVKKLTGSFDEVLVDCPAGLDRGFRTAISGAQTALIVTQDEPVCRRDAERAHMLLKREGVDECRLLVNRMRWQKGSSSTGRARELAEALEVPLLGVVPEDEAVAACAQEGKFLLERADSRAAQAIERIAGRLLGEESDIPDVTRRSLWERLRGE